MYCKSLFNYSRFPTPSIGVGDLNLGGSEPIRIQTMTNTLLSDISKTTEQIISCFENGADMVRISVPSINDIENLREIMINLRKIIFDKPIIADIHFNPQIALKSCELVNKVRINPGNFIKNKNIEIYTDQQYADELNEIEVKLSELIDKCMKNKRAIRVGTNHGSLSKRIISKYGNTITGLVQSSIEYLEICKKKDFKNVVVSIKASNPTIMIMANRLLAEEMQKRDLVFPIHIGVTEAGNGQEGRVKSAMGIGALLLDGIGDTIRVSLTENPENELPVAQKIVDHIKTIANSEKLPESDATFFNPYSFSKRDSYQVENIGGNNVPVVILNSFDKEIYFDEFLPDYVFCSQIQAADPWISDVSSIVEYKEWDEDTKHIPIMNVQEYLTFNKNEQFCFVRANYKDLSKKIINKIRKNKNVVFIAEAETNNKVGELRLFFAKLAEYECKAPVIIKFCRQRTEDLLKQSLFLVLLVEEHILILKK